MGPLKGTHGTCLTFATLIAREGFKVSSDGRAGEGVYFWGYVDPLLERFAEDFAIGWWKYCKNDGRYEKASDQSGAIVYVTLNASEPDFDFESQSIREAFIKFANRVYTRVKKGKYNARVSAVYDLFLKQMESTLKRRFSVIHVKLTPPPKEFYSQMLPLDITGHPSCYVVRDLSLIRITRVRKI